MIDMPNSCHGVLPKHVFATVNHMKTSFEVKYESFFIDFKSLFQGVNINEKEIAKFISQTSSTCKPIRIADVLKKIGLHRLNHKNRVTSILIYVIFGIISLLVILFCVIYLKKRQSKPFRRPSSLPHTYANLNCLTSDMGMELSESNQQDSIDVGKQGNPQAARITKKS